MSRTRDQAPNPATAREIARELGVGVRTVYGWRRYDDFPTPVRTSPVSMWDLEEVREWARATAERRRPGRRWG